MKYYNKIPKRLRKKYRSRMTGRFWLLIKARFKFNKLYKESRNLFNMGKPEDNLDLPDDHLYWYYDCSEEVDGKLDYDSCTYGDLAYRKRIGFDINTASEKQKKKQARRWLIRRNPLWNRNLREGLELKGTFIVLKKIVDEGPGSILNWRDKKDIGFKVVILKSEAGITCFRYSYTLPLNWWNPIHLIGILFGYRWRNRMLGAGNHRYIYKNRWFKNIEK